MWISQDLDRSLLVEGAVYRLVLNYKGDFAGNDKKDELEILLDYVVKRRLSFSSANLGVEELISGIQNTFVDSDNNTYLTFSYLI